MSSIDHSPELSAALDRLVPVEEMLRGDWDDVVGRVDRRRSRTHPRRRHASPLRLAIALAVLVLLLAGVATATYLLVRGNGKIAFQGALGTLVVVSPNGPELRTIARCAPGTPSCAILEPSWSPDGTRVAFIRGRLGGPNTSSTMSLYVEASDGRGVRRLAVCGACGEQWGGRLGWSPDGTRIALSRDAGPTGQESLWVVAATRGRPRRLTDCRPAWCADVDPVWSPNGQLLAFRRTALASPGDLYTVRPNGSGLTRIASGADPQWSPDGRRIAFDEKDSIAVANADGSDVHVLFAGTAGSGPGVPAWSPDGSKLAFFNTPGRPGHFRAEVWTMNGDGSAKQRLYRSGCCVGDWAGPIWSPDGRMIAFSADSAGGTFVINTDGSGLRRLSPTTSSGLSWQRRPRR